MTSAEKQFRAKYPNARYTVELKGRNAIPTFTVYAGDYLCAESWNRARAFKAALEFDETGLIKPDPNEQSLANA